MNKPDKHTPLSPEELFKLLEDNSGRATDFDGMDDFEKDALEGFTKFSSPEKAVAMVDEVNLAVSKKVSEGTGTTKKNKIIWFSAAASIIVLMMISVFFLNESKKESASNVAILDQAPLPVEQSTIAKADETITAAEPMDEKSRASGESAAGKAERKEAFKQGFASRTETQEAKPGSGISSEAAFAEIKTMEESEKTNDNNTFTLKGNVDAKDMDLLKKRESETGDKLAAVKPSAVTTTKNRAENANGYSAPSTGSTNNVSVTSIEQNTAKYDTRIAAQNAAADKAKDVTAEKAAKNSKAKEKSPAYKAVDSEMDQEVESAYYKGGELAIKEYVLSYLQKTGAVVTGKYKVKANVLTNGKLKVKVVDHITKEMCKDCETILKNALSEMTGWTPAMWGKTASDSSVDFVLSF